MSVEVSAWVWKHAPVKSGELVVLLALADNAHDDGGGAYPSQAYLARKSRMTERQVRNCLRALEERRLIRKQGTTGKGFIVWQLLMSEEGGPEDLSGRKSAAGEGGNQLPTEPSVEPSEVSIERALARMRISGKPVDPMAWERTLWALSDFNEFAGRNLEAVTGRGQPSDVAKRIYLRLVEWPDLDGERVEQIVRLTLASRWWGDGAPSVGVVFGPNVWEENMGREETDPPSPAAREDRKEARRAEWDAWLEDVGEVVDAEIVDESEEAA